MKIGLRTIKSVIAAVLTLIVCEFLQLKFATVASVIALLNLLPTKKKKTMRITTQRFLSLGLGTILAAILFLSLGYTPFSFGVFLLFFIPLSVFFNIGESIIPITVLITHYFNEQSLAPSLILNEVGLLVVSMIFPILLNMYMPHKEKRQQENQELLDEMFRIILRKYALYLNRPKRLTALELALNSLKNYLEQFQKEATDFQENHWWGEETYYVSYFTMRSLQWKILHQMILSTQYQQFEEDQTIELKRLISLLAITFHEKNDGRVLLSQIEKTQKIYEDKPLPKTREEFEARARLFQIFQLFSEFVMVKNQFVTAASDESLSKNEI